MTTWIRLLVLLTLFLPMHSPALLAQNSATDQDVGEVEDVESFGDIEEDAGAETDDRTEPPEDSATEESAETPTNGGPQVAPPPSGRDFDLKVPDGVTPKHGKYQKLMTRNSDGVQQVCRLLSRVEDDLVVIRPTGELDIVNRSDIQRTDDAFGKVSKKDIAEVVKKTGLTGFKMAAAKPYVYVYGCSESFYMHTRSILESMYPGVLAKLREWGLKAPDPELPLIVVIMPSREAFDKLKKMPEGVAAYYSVIQNQIVLYEDQKFSSAAPELALKQSAYTIAHEGVHQILANTNIQQRLSDWPMWISEGLPEYFCPLSVNSRILKQGDDDLPVRTLKWTRAGKVNDLRMYDLLKRRGQGGKIIRTVVKAEGLTASGYAVAWGLVHYLVNEKPEEFKQYLSEVSKTPPLSIYTDETESQEKLFTKYFGDDYPRLERKVREHLTSRQIQKDYRDPIVHQTVYVTKRVVKQGKTFHIAAMITLSPASAKKWRDDQEALHDDIKFTTFACKTMREARYQLTKIMRLGR